MRSLLSLIFILVWCWLGYSFVNVLIQNSILNNPAFKAVFALVWIWMMFVIVDVIHDK
jgi:hypothetical protein